MNNIEELREHCEEMIAISRMQYAYIPASSIITLIDRIEKAEKESKQWYSVVEAAISDDAEWRKQSNTASEAIGYLTTGIVMLKERAEKAEAELSAANEKHGWIKRSDQMPDPNQQRRVCVFTPSSAADLRYRLVPANLFKAVCSSSTHWHYVNDPVEGNADAE
ncbi:hypothetical protein [Yersinia proxima]|uniref:hypothetical protein n=1 Tax=Yersinia proxima TaxID=2890316 RepID=UPI0005DC6C16|nr:hypothetical protein [Yersinia proxima]CNL52668.1 phage-like protein [Yersinia intermedia]